MVVLARKFLRPIVGLTGARRKFSSQKTALAGGSIKYVNSVNFSSNSNQLCLRRCLSTASNENADSNVNPLHEDLKKSVDRVVTLVQSVEVMANSLSEKSNKLLRCQEEIDALKKQVKSLQDDVATGEAKLFIEKFLSDIRLRIEFLEEENNLDDYKLSRNEEEIVWELSDAKERRIKIDEFKWLFSLSPSNPNFDREENQSLLRIFEENNISVGKACRAIAAIRQHFRPRWNRWERGEWCFDYDAYDVVIEVVKANRDVFDCL